MANCCEICGKKTTFGTQYCRRGAYKKDGGSGAKISGKSPRTFKPNLQNVRALVNGAPTRMRVCTCCIQKGKVVKAVRGTRKLAAAPVQS